MMINGAYTEHALFHMEKHKMSSICFEALNENIIYVDDFGTGGWNHLGLVRFRMEQTETLNESCFNNESPKPTDTK